MITNYRKFISSIYLAGIILFLPSLLLSQQEQTDEIVQQDNSQRSFFKRLGNPYHLSSGNIKNIPREYRKLYSLLDAYLDSYEKYLVSQNNGRSSPVIFGAELLPANCNQGERLLKPQAIQEVILYLSRLQELGVQGVTFNICYLLFTPNFPRYQEYLKYYKKVVQEIRNRGMKLDIETGVIFPAPFSSLPVDYSRLTFDTYKKEKKEMTAVIIQELHPDYINLGSEPDTEAKITGLKELNDPDKYVELVNFILADLDKEDTELGAGIGTWSSLESMKGLASRTNLDFICMHIYPVNKQALQNTIFIADIAQKYNKKVIADEVWLYKSFGGEVDSIAANDKVFKRDMYSFWIPLDIQFLEFMVKLAKIKNIEYISPFWTTYFFGYVDYGIMTRNLSFAQLREKVNKEAVKNMLEDKFTRTGEGYKRIIQENQ